MKTQISSLLRLTILSGLVFSGCSSETTMTSRVGPKGSAEASAAPSSPTPSSTSTGVQSNSSTDSTVALASKIHVIPNEAENLTARWALLDRAKKSVWIQTYILKGDYSGRKFAEKLVALKAKGIDVKIIVDEQINLAPQAQRLYADTYNKGLPILGFNPLYSGLIFPLAESGNVATYFASQNKRSHEKLFIIDHEDPENGMAILGGANISNDYFQIVPASTGGYWRDKDVVVKGGIVGQMATYFTKSYAYHQQLNANIESKANGVLTTQLKASIQKLLGAFDKEQPIEVQNFAQHIARPFSPTWHDVQARFLVQDGSNGVQEIYNEYLRLFATAQSEITIANGYFIPDDVQIAAIRSAAARGVQVRILTNSKETTDYPQIARAGQLHYNKLLTGSTLPISLYEWGKPGVKAYALYHSKWICVDGKTCIVGSFNFDPRSKNLNKESAVVFDSPEAADELQATFDADTLPTTSVLITPAMAKSLLTPADAKEWLVDQLIARFLPNL